MRIGIDLDEVLADFLPALIDYHNITYGTSLTRDQFYNYKFWEIWAGTRDKAIQKIYNFHKTSYFRNIKPVAGSQNAIKILNQNNELFVITSRQDDIIDETKEWIDKNFLNTFSGIYFTNNYSKSGMNRSKSEICDNLNVQILIEDSLDYALECLKPERRVLLLDCPWNKSSNLEQGIHRVYSWEEILEVINIT